MYELLECLELTLGRVRAVASAAATAVAIMLLLHTAIAAGDMAVGARDLINGRAAAAPLSNENPDTHIGGF